MGPNVKPLTHWVIYRGYKVRFTSRSPQAVTGILTLPAGADLAFRYDPVQQVIFLAGERITINEFGWETEKDSEE